MRLVMLLRLMPMVERLCSMAAGLACHIAGIDEATIRKSLGDFPGVEHRLEKVCKVNWLES